MKNKILTLCFVAGVFIVVFTVLYYSQAGKTNEAMVSIGESTKFTENEILEAIDVVKKKFRGFEGCTLTELWYSENHSNEMVKEYLKTGKGASMNLQEENVIVLLSNFLVNSSGGDGSFEPNSLQTDWRWIVIRDNETDKWRVDDWGY